MIHLRKVKVTPHVCCNYSSTQQLYYCYYSTTTTPSNISGNQKTNGTTTNQQSSSSSPKSQQTTFERIDFSKLASRNTYKVDNVNSSSSSSSEPTNNNESDKNSKGSHNFSFNLNALFANKTKPDNSDKNTNTTNNNNNNNTNKSQFNFKDFSFKNMNNNNNTATTTNNNNFSKFPNNQSTFGNTFNFNNNNVNSNNNNNNNSIKNNNNNNNPYLNQLGSLYNMKPNNENAQPSSRFSPMTDSFKDIFSQPTPQPQQQLQQQQQQTPKTTTPPKIQYNNSIPDKSKKKKEEEEEPVDKQRKVIIPLSPTLENLAPELGVRVVDIAKWMIKLQLKPTSRFEILTEDIIELMAQDFEFTPILQEISSIDYKADKVSKVDPSWPRKAPVVTIVGHIDHGKTSLLDYLRKTTMVEKEAGRITQHIGAFEVKLSSGESITFMDTPGHAAFSTMRQRGVNSTDIALLIIAADDGVQEQTIEAIKAIHKSNVQYIVVINKMDKPGVDSSIVKQQLLEHGVSVEGFGGSIPVVEISAKTGQGIQALEESIVLLSEIMDLRSPIKGASEGVIIESSFKKSRGAYSTVLIQRGILKPGQFFVTNNSYGKIKELKNHLGNDLKEAKPGQPVVIFGFKEGIPQPGEEFIIVDSEKKMIDILNEKKEKLALEETKNQIELLQQNEEEEELKSNEKEGEEEDEDEIKKKIINLHIKGDVGGSTEALATSIINEVPEDPEIQLVIKKQGYGEVTEMDVRDASFFKYSIVYFGAGKPGGRVVEEAKRLNVPLIQGDIIYHVIQDFITHLETVIDPIDVYDIAGEADVAQVFDIDKSSKIEIKVGGSKVRHGTIKRGARARVLRNGESIHEGKVEMIKHFKEQVKEITKGQECGIALKDFNDLQEGDQIVSYTKKKFNRKLGKQIVDVYNYNSK
eukprot:gene5605-6975_t